ncbi:MAG: carboxypeptidase-like regulatory domain-containing protein, partial [Prevotellaceae bacterium]|nr:carboxypeptidase-like regulatory domain-containing protein [Prevotellaceae bacterium]
MKRLSIVVTLIAFAQIIAAQSLAVTGTVTDADDASTLPGVNVVVKNTTNGTVTDIDGRYQITANRGDIIVFSFTGYKSVEKTVSSSVIDVQISQDTKLLDEVVAIGYGTMRKKDLTGAVSSV